jgi:hypothetical protein
MAGKEADYLSTMDPEFAEVRSYFMILLYNLFLDGYRDYIGLVLKTG